MTIECPLIQTVHHKNCALYDTYKQDGTSECPYNFECKQVIESFVQVEESIVNLENENEHGRN